MMRLRTGNDSRRGCDAVRRARSPAGRSRARDRTACGAAAGTRRRARCRARRPRRRRASSAPSCAAASIPIASPLTTVTPARASTAPSSYASARPCGVAARVPTTATRRRVERRRARRPRRAAPSGGRGDRRRSDSRRDPSTYTCVRAARRGVVEHRSSAARLLPVRASATRRREVLGARVLAQHRRRQPALRAPASAPDRPAPPVEKAAQAGGGHVGEARQRRRRDLDRIEGGAPGRSDRRRCHGTSPRSSAALSRCVGVDVGSVVEVGERARHPPDRGPRPGR